MKFDYINSRGDVLSLINSENFILVNIDGQTAAASNISSVVTGGVDGDSVNSIQAQPRPLVLDLKILKNVEKTKENIRNCQVKAKWQDSMGTRRSYT